MQPDDPRGAQAVTPDPAGGKTSAVCIVVDPVTGLPALSAGPGAPTLTSAQVEEILSCFP